MAHPPKIFTPQKTTSERAELTFASDFHLKWESRYSRAQKFVDSEVLRRSEPFTPLRTGTLIKSGQLGTDLGSGLVSWIVPYSARQYYLPRPVGSETGKLRGSMWFERMKAVHAISIISGAKRMMNS